jgi:hypothetical protein
VSTGKHRLRSVLGRLSWCAALLAGGAACAAEPLTRAEQSVINFGFATQLGSGIYTLSGRTLQVYRMPFGYTLPAADEARVRVRLSLPVTIGIADFEPIDVLESGLPQGLDSLSFVPGVKVRIAVSEQWQLEPFVEAGIAQDRTSELDQTVYAGGLRSDYEFDHGDTRWLLSQELLHVVVEQDATNGRDDCTRFRFGASARRGFGATIGRQRPDYLLYAFTDVYTDTPAGPVEGEGDGGAGAQFEVGVTFGTVETMRVWRIPLPRVGIGYRFGNDLSALRIVFGSAF